MAITLSDAAKSEIQQMLTIDIVPRVAPELALLFPMFETLTDWGAQQWIGIRCDHPRYPRGSWFEPPRTQIFIKYRLGESHLWLIGNNGRAWAMRRARLLLRLLLKRLAREVAKAKEVSHP